MSLVNRQEAMERLGDDEELFAEICDLFCRDVPEMLTAMQSGLAAGDLHQVVRSAHSIKSASSSIGAEQLSELARCAEDAGRAGDVAGIQNLVAPLEVAVESVMKELQSPT